MTKKVKRFKGRVALGMDGVENINNLSLDGSVPCLGDLSLEGKGTFTGDPK
jgi:hypothetical protein